MAGEVADGKILALEFSSSSSLPISACIDQWLVQYARYVHWNSSYFSDARPSLVPVPVPIKCRRGAWISTDAASIKIAYRRSVAVIVISVRATILEEHYISKLHFTWPLVECVSGFPSRASRAVFLSYKDGVGQIQKFVVRFFAVDEARQFMDIVKLNLENTTEQPIPSFGFDSGLSSQAEVVPSDELAYRPAINWPSPNGVDMSSQLMLPSSEYLSVQHTESYAGIVKNEVGETKPVDPPSFSQLLKGCQDVSEEKSKISEEVIKAQLMHYLGRASFQEILTTVEEVMNSLDDGVVL